MQKYSKYLLIKSKNTQKDHLPLNGYYPREAEMVYIQKSVNVTHHINKLKEINHMIITLDAEKPSTKSNTPS